MQESEDTGLVIGHLTSREASGWSDLFASTSICLGTADTALEAPIEPITVDMMENSGALTRTGMVRLLGGSRSGVFATVAAYYAARMVKPRPVRVVLMSPLLRVWPEMSHLRHPAYRTLMQRAEQDPKVLEALERDGDAVKILDRIQQEKLDVKFTIVLGRNHKRDMEDTARIRHYPNVRVIELDSEEHLTFFWLKAKVDQPNAMRRALELTARNNWPKLNQQEVAKKAELTVEQVIHLRKTYGNLDQLYAAMDEPASAEA